jgi:hypothetical protein
MDTPSPQNGVVHQTCAAFPDQKRAWIPWIAGDTPVTMDRLLIKVGQRCAKPLATKMLQGRGRGRVDLNRWDRTVDADNDRRSLWRLVHSAVYRDGWHTSPSIVAHFPTSVLLHADRALHKAALHSEDGEHRWRSASMAAAIIYSTVPTLS